MVEISEPKTPLRLACNVTFKEKIQKKKKANTNNRKAVFVYKRENNCKIILMT